MDRRRHSITMVTDHGNQLFMWVYTLCHYACT